MAATSIKLGPCTNTNFCFRLPREHGAVVTFALASFLSLCLCGASPLVLFNLTLIWLLFLSLHNSRQLLMATALATTLIIFRGCPLVCLLPVLLVSCAPAMIRWVRKKTPTVSETVAMLGVSATPFLVVPAAGNACHIETLTVAASFCASTLVATFLVRAARGDIALPSVFVSFGLWLVVSLLAPVLVAVCLAPFAIEAIWLRYMSRPSFKTLGIAGTICMLVVTSSLTFWLSSN